MTTFNLAVVSRSVWSIEFVYNPELSNGSFKKVKTLRLELEKRFVNSKPLSVCTHPTLNPLPPIKLNGFYYKIGRGVGALFPIGADEAKAGAFINSSVLVQLRHLAHLAASRGDLDVNLFALTGPLHLFMRLGLVFPLNLPLVGNSLTQPNAIQ